MGTGEVEDVQDRQQKREQVQGEQEACAQVEHEEQGQEGKVVHGVVVFAVVVVVVSREAVADIVAVTAVVVHEEGT